MRHIEADANTWGASSAEKIDRTAELLREAHTVLKNTPAIIGTAENNMLVGGGDTSRRARDLRNLKGSLEALVEQVESSYSELAGLVARHGS